MSKVRMMLGGKKKLFTKRFFPAGNYTWTVPPGCTEVDVFLVGGGGGGGEASGGGGGYTKTYKKDMTGWRDGDVIKVTPGQSIPVVVGAGGKGSGGYGNSGGDSQFLNYRASGGSGGSRPGNSANGYKGGNGGCGGASYQGGTAGSDGANATNGSGAGGSGQGHTTRDWGESVGKRNAGGGAANVSASRIGGVSDYIDGTGNSASGQSGSATGGGGYGGGGAGADYTVGGKGGDGTVLIRYWAYSAE